MTEHTLPRHYLYGFIMFTMAIMVGLGLMSHVNLVENNLLNDKEAEDYHFINSSFQKYNDLNSSIYQLKSSVEVNQDAGWFEKTLGVLGSLAKASFNSTLLLFSSFGFITDVFGSISILFPEIPYWVGGLLVLLITVLITFAIFTVVFQREI